MNTPKSKKPFIIAVAGGGIGGLAITIGLLHQGIDVHLYEAAHTFAEIGAGVAFGPNALAAMSKIDPAIKEGYDKRATVNGWPEKREVWFDFRHGEEGTHVGELIHTVKAGKSGNSTVHRAHFLDELVKLVPDEVAHFGKRVEEVVEKDDGVTLKFHDGTTAEASAVIGCDGVKSRTRQVLLGYNAPEAHAVFTGKYAYRGLIPMEKAVELLGDELARNSQMFLGHHGHVLTFPIEKGATMNVVAFRTKEDGKWENDQWVLPMKKEDMFHDFDDWGKNVKDILSSHPLPQLMQKPDIWALFDHVPAPTYHRKRIYLLGDSAHASTPHQGAGAGMALEDAFILSNLLGSVHDLSGLEHAFRAADVVRRPRTQKLVTTSRSAGQLYDFELEGIGDDIEKVKENLETRYRWIWDEDLDGELQRAKSLLGERAKLA
ncbi:MAG: hypothetical protein M1827_006328 [Pycnora praestabilis]|nr:MAG: hypothetical protein M1827_006328 [Pycnora praestabilis]